MAADEERRLDALYAHDILDTVPETGFDDIVRLAARLCATPVALISFVERDRQWFKAKVGFEPGQTPIEESVCKHAIGLDDLLVIPDLTLDARTRSNPLVVSPPHLRFYAGAPLVTPEGRTLGTICVIDRIPRPDGLSPLQADDLRALARQVMTLLEMRRIAASRDALLRRSEKDRRRAETEHLRLASMFEQTPSFMAMLKGPDHVFELANPAYLRLVGEREIIGKSVAQALPDAARQGYLALLDEVYRSGKTVTQKGARYAVQTGPGAVVRERYLDFVYQPIRDEDDAVAGIFVEGSDVTAHVRRGLRGAALAHLGERLRDLTDPDAITKAAADCIASAIGGNGIGFGKVDPKTETVEVTTGWCSHEGISVVGSYHFRAFGSYIDDLKNGITVAIPDVDLDPRTASRAESFRKLEARAFLNLPIMAQGVLQVVIFAFSDHARAWTEEEIDLVRQIGDRTHLALARVRAEREQHILNEELSHRLKNTLAIVQAIAGQTLRQVSDRDSVTAFTKRIGALSRAHDALLEKRWISADLKNVAETVLATFEQSDQFVIEGPDLQIGSRATMSLSLLLHELATNASKYGALTVPTGTVSLRWQVRDDADDPTLCVVWTETGGPAIRTPTGTGFGSRLIGLGLIGTGGVDIRYDQSGLTASMEASLSQMQQS